MTRAASKALKRSTSVQPWLKHYPDAVPASIDALRLKNLTALLTESVRLYGNKPAFTCMGRSISFNQLDIASYQFACYLRNHLRLVQGARVALMMPNILQYPIALFGILRAGLIVVNVNPLYTPRELTHQLKDSGAEAIVLVENVGATLEKCLAETSIKHVILTGLGDQLGFLRGLMVNWVVRYQRKLVPDYDLPQAVGFNSALAQAAAERLPAIEIKSSDLAFLQYTGGTTGVSKGAMLTHGNILANIEQGWAWFGLLMKPGQETLITALPLYHIFALTVNTMLYLRLGANNVLITDPRDMRGFVRTLSQVPFSVITGVNTLFNSLLHTEGFSRLDFSRLKLTGGGGAAVQRTVAENWKSVTGSTIVEGYGLTETSPVVLMNPVTCNEFSGAIGVPLPSTEAKIVDEAGRTVGYEQPGELCVRGPQVMAGYWQRPEETSNVLSADGWLKTGDVAKRSKEELFFIVDRKKDMILVSGFNVFPNEIEEVLMQHPGVLECAVVGVPNASTGESVKAVIVKKEADLNQEDVLKHCRAQLTAYKVPKLVQFVASLPKSNVGKILRRELR